ncbi:MAG: prepilin-type N-terminal cleavage/methylation domain-containing protein [Lachnospiraceae bacterium]|nr:prepilin-type N-terminal cleavage/methylation domain-containing protein [Lachnospiraceae bacterium]
MKTNNNKGFSYVEMLMVLAVMAIMIGMVTISIGTINRNTVARTSEKLESLSNKARTSALTKGSQNGYLNLCEVGNGVYVYVGEMLTNPADVKSKGEKICSAEYEVLIKFLGTDYTSSKDKAIHRWAFKQSTGGIIGTIDSSTPVSGSVVVRKKSNTIKQSAFQIYWMTGKTFR